MRNRVSLSIVDRGSDDIRRKCSIRIGKYTEIWRFNTAEAGIRSAKGRLGYEGSMAGMERIIDAFIVLDALDIDCI